MHFMQYANPNYEQRGVFSLRFIPIYDGMWIVQAIACLHYGVPIFWSWLPFSISYSRFRFVLNVACCAMHCACVRRMHAAFVWVCLCVQFSLFLRTNGFALRIPKVRAREIPCFLVIHSHLGSLALGFADSGYESQLINACIRSSYTFFFLFFICCPFSFFTQLCWRLVEQRKMGKNSTKCT